MVDAIACVMASWSVDRGRPRGAPGGQGAPPRRAGAISPRKTVSSLNKKMQKPRIRKRLGLSRVIEARNIVGVPEIAETTGVLRGTVYMWRYRHKTFPKPIVELKNGPIFDWQEVRAWLDAR